MHAIHDVLMPISIIGTFGTSIYFFTKVLTDYILRKKMIEKGYVTEESQSLFKTYKSDNRYGSLKWGLIILSAGIALIIMDFINVEPDSTLPYGIFAVSVSLGFLVYYGIVKRETK
jgi:amino acid transporter